MANKTVKQPHAHTFVEKVRSDSELAAKLARRHKLIDAAKEFEKLDKEVKAELQEMGPVVNVGPFLVQNVVTPTTVYDIPADVKAPYARKKEYIKTTITMVQ